MASIKPNRSGQAFSQFVVSPGGRFAATNTSVRDLILVVYQIQSFQLQGGPAWIESERFDITAKAGIELPRLPAILPAAETPLAFVMVQSLLAERFGLVARHETRDAPIYALVMTRADRRLGPQLQASVVDCVAIRAAARGRPPAGIPPPPPPPPLPGERPTCGVRGAPGFLAAGGMPLAAIIPGLSRTVNRHVVDRTNLTGNFDLTLEFTPELPPPGLSADAAPPARSDSPSIFTALQEQLGLKLEPERGPVEFLVVDQVQRPTEN